MARSQAKDPLALAAYSYVGVGAADASCLLAEPVAHRSFFTGEASKSAFAADRHSAMHSASRAADEILAQLERN